MMDAELVAGFCFVSNNMKNGLLTFAALSGFFEGISSAGSI